MTVTAERPGIDPVLQRLLDAAPFRLLGDDGLAAARRRLIKLHSRMPAELLPDLRIDNRHLPISSPDGVGVRIYWPPDNPDRTGPPPLLMFFHGGGFAVGNLDTHDAAARNHAVGADAV